MSNGKRSRLRRQSTAQIAAVSLTVLAILGAAVYADISWFLVGGILEIVRGAQATPVSAHDIAWGAVRLACSGITTTLVLLTGFAAATVIADEL